MLCVHASHMHTSEKLMSAPTFADLSEPQMSHHSYEQIHQIPAHIGAYFVELKKIVIISKLHCKHDLAMRNAQPSIHPSIHPCIQAHVETKSQSKQTSELKTPRCVPCIQSGSTCMSEESFTLTSRTTTDDQSTFTACTTGASLRIAPESSPNAKFNSAALCAYLALMYSWYNNP